VLLKSYESYHQYAEGILVTREFSLFRHYKHLVSFVFRFFTSLGRFLIRERNT